MISLGPDNNTWPFVNLTNHELRSGRQGSTAACQPSQGTCTRPLWTSIKYVYIQDDNFTDSEVFRLYLCRKEKFLILHSHTIYEVCKTIVLLTVLIIIVETVGSSLCLFWTLLCYTH